MSWSNILRYKPGLFFPQSLWCCNYQRCVYLEQSHDHSGFRSVVNKSSVANVRDIICWVRYMLHLHTCLLLQYQSAEDYLILSMLWWLLFCQALKHSGRLIKSVPQAAAPSAHTEKCSSSLSYITRKMRGCFEVHQSYFFFLWAPSKKPAGARVLEPLEEEELILTVYPVSCPSCPRVYYCEWVCTLAPTSPLSSYFLLLHYCR